MIDKIQAGYHISRSDIQCENCVMFKSGSCDLVMGLIEPYAVCVHWLRNPGDVNSVAQHLARNGVDDVQAGL
jgi:hypothetical protein